MTFAATPVRWPPYVQPIGPGFSVVKAPNRMRFPHCNGFLLTGRRTLLVDAGIGTDRIREIDRCRRIDILLVSHSHPDHILGWHELSDRHLMLPRETPDVVGDLQALGTRFTGTPEGGAHWARRMKGQYGLHPLRDPDSRYGNGQRISVGGGACLEAIHAPGHLLDHYCFFEPASGTLLATDVDLTGFGPWYGNPEADIDRFEADIEKLAAVPARSVCSAHKPPMDADDGRVFDTYRQALHRQLTSVRDCCRSPATVAAMVAASPYYGNRFPDPAVQRIYETQMVKKALQRLERDGRVTRRGNEFVAVDGHP